MRQNIFPDVLQAILDAYLGEREHDIFFCDKLFELVAGVLDHLTIGSNLEVNILERCLSIVVMNLLVNSFPGHDHLFKVVGFPQQDSPAFGLKYDQVEGFNRCVLGLSLKAEVYQVPVGCKIEGVGFKERISFFLSFSLSLLAPRFCFRQREPRVA